MNNPMTPDDITRLAWSSKIISELAGLTCLRVSDKHFDAEVLPREAVMAAVCKIRDATREGEAVIRTLARQGKAGGVREFSAWVGDMKTSAGIDYYVCVGHGEGYGEYLTTHKSRIRGRAEYEVAEWNHLFGRGDKPDILAYDTDPATPPANPPEAGVTDDAETLAMKIYAAHLVEYQHTTLGQQVWDRITEDARNHWVNVARRLTAALATQPKDAT